MLINWLRLDFSVNFKSGLGIFVIKLNGAVPSGLDIGLAFQENSLCILKGKIAMEVGSQHRNSSGQGLVLDTFYSVKLVSNCPQIGIRVCIPFKEGYALAKNLDTL
ncbi:hypothetical protein LWI28_013637 [Acer negundo]|uniref:Uncharacterized protein n=1 Tax=Acer negundo TaxID=4023 RepID=A0AAD5NH87_ACENE|nr:hypothetical protein LWI28_013637 [Acer negundo]